MVSVDDDAAPAVFVEQCCADHAGLTRVELRHGVEKVGEAPEAAA